MKYKKRTDDKTTGFSIGAKLVLIISVLVLVSLGSITALVSYLVSQDLRITAEANNFEVNRRSALEAEAAFANVQANTIMMANIIGSEQEGRITRVFFEQNPYIAAVVFSVRGQTNRFFINDRFFALKEIDTSLARQWTERQTQLLRRAAGGETLIVNEVPNFAFSLLTFAFPWQEGATEGSIAVLFSAESLIDSFGFGTNLSYLINGDDDLLVHSNFDLLRTGVNLSGNVFIREMRRSTQRNLQTLYTDNDEVRFFGAFTKLNIGGAALVTTIEYDKVFEGIVATTWRNILLTGAVLSISILLIYFFAKTISIPLKMLAAAARQIESGNFEIYLKQKGRDEIGVLTASFQKMSGALGIFGKFTNREIALLAMRGQIKPGGLPKHATIFFSDIRGFTQMSEEFTKTFGNKASDKIVFWLNEYLTEMVECVEKTNGTIDKFIGDAVMALWGTASTSGSVKKDALNCVLSALMMRAAVFKMNKARRANDKSNPPINIGCGINTGMVTAGQIGSEQRMEYTVIGDAVNLASRVESLNKPLGTDILISENTWNLVKDYLITEEMPPVTVKGKEKPVRLFAVINVLASKKGPHTLTEMRKLLGIKPPEGAVDLNAEEKKFKIASREDAKTQRK